MVYLVDSDWVIDHLANIPEATQFLERLSEEGIAISIITYMEVYQGLLRSPDPEEAEAKFQVFLEQVPIFPFSQAVAVRCAHLREELKNQGKRVNARAMDLLIAATALEYMLTLVTRNTEDYQDIPDLKLYEPS